MIFPQGVPRELKAYPQWVCWKYEDADGGKPTKVPYSAITGKHAAVNRPETWCSFDQAVLAEPNYSGIGFVLTEADPFVFIDLDDPKTDKDPLATHKRQGKIYSEFNSYTEHSPSRTGVHILVRGQIPSGRKRSKIEIYSSGRFMTVTGDILKDSLIEERDELANLLWSQMGGPAAIYSNNGEAPQTMDDDAVLERASHAVNGDKFNELANGDWRNLYSSQSEADYAFIDIIAFYTQNREQIARIFRASKLGERDKAKRNDYVNYMVNNSLDNLLPPIDLDGLRIQIESKLEQSKISDKQETSVAVHVVTTQTEYTIPPGLMGQIASYIYSASPRPVPEIALCAAIGLMSGITGKAYNISGTGLNHYTLLLAPTGSGKEAIASGIDKLMSAVRETVPAVDKFIGPAEIASPQALIKYLSSSSSCFLSVVGEYGLQLRQMTADSNNPVAAGLKRALLNLYNKSGFNQRFHEMIYSNKDNNASAVDSPAFSLLGESTPESFYGSLDESSVADGLLPRFTIVEYHGPRVPFVEGNMGRSPSLELVTRLGDVATQALTLINNKKVINVGMNLPAKEFLDQYDKFCDCQINGSAKDVVKQLWNRAHIRIMKLAAMVAVGLNPYEPVIDMVCLNWAAPIITNNVMRLLARFEAGDIGAAKVNSFGGASETTQVQEAVKAIRRYYTDGHVMVDKYKIPAAMYKDRVITYAYLQRALSCVATYRHDRGGATQAIKRSLQVLLDTDILREVGKQDLILKYQTKQRAFILADTSLLQAQ